MPRALRRFLRMLTADPWYASTVILTIGLGIGISTAAFTVVDRLVFRTPPGVRAASPAFRNLPRAVAGLTTAR